jgi:hypothetical protein
LQARDAFWAISGWGSIDCQGLLVWAYEGDANACYNVPTEAASVTLYANTVMRWDLSNQRNCGSGLKRADDPANTNLTETSFVTEPGKPVTLATGPGKPGNLSATDMSGDCQNNGSGGIWAFRATIIG